MNSLWIPVSLTAAFFQTWRTAMQQKLRGQLSVGAAGFTRYLYAVPAGFVLLAIAMAATGLPIPEMGWRFVFLCAAGGLGQIFGTVLLIAAFGHRNFVVGTAYSKTESIQSGFLAWITLGEALKPGAWLGIAVAVGGVLVLSFAGARMRPRDILAASIQPAALCGLGAGFAFSVTSIFIKLANQDLGRVHPVFQALVVLVVTNILQTLMQGAWMAWRERDQLLATFRLWRRAWLVGVLSACGSACWFTGFALAPVALVRAVGQIEMVFTLVFSRYYLRERPTRADITGLLLIVAGVTIILFLGR
jgi:drug/metabolite transporter (DMT)-like permease